MKAPTIDPLVILATIGPAIVRKGFVDCGSSDNVLFKKAYDQMMLEEKDLKPCKSRIYGFNGMATEPIGYVELPMVIARATANECESCLFGVGYLLSLQCIFESTNLD